MLKIVLATGNRGKIREIRELLGAMSIELLTLDDFGGLTMPPEDGITFEENAYNKARYVANETKLAALADDSGLVVRALSGAPGIRSARYAGSGATDGENIDKLLKELGDRPEGDRQASFICALALVGLCGEAPCEEIVTGRVDGIILRERRGDKGFGYDPVFYIPALKRTMAELTKDEKNRVSHRGMALRKLKERLEGLLAEGDS